MNKQTENWEEEFDEEFGSIIDLEHNFRGVPSAGLIKSFIRQQLQKAREEVIRECLESLPKESKDHFLGIADRGTFAMMYNEAIKQMQQNLKKLLEKHD